MKSWPFIPTSRTPIRKKHKDLEKTTSKGRRRARFQPILEQLEDRVLFATNVTTYHFDYQSTGANLAETQLTPANVSQASFGQLFSTGVDGQIYAQPLVMTNVTITGPNAGTYPSVVFVATENDSLYAINGSSGAILWQRSFLDITNGNDFLPNASSVTTVPATDTGSTDIQPTIGITGTPVIDPATKILYLDVSTKETVSGVVHYVQRLHAISLADGSDFANSFLTGNTTGSDTNASPIFVNGTGDSSVGGVVSFNALHEANRAALSLVNGIVYVSWASHGDARPYHGWIAAWNVANLQPNGTMALAGVLNTDPNGSGAGIWQSGGGLSFEPDGSAFYVETGNGFGRSGNPTLDANGFPTDRDFYESLLKVVADPTTSASNQNANGWGLKITDYFTPYNVAALDANDEDFGSGPPLVLPNSAGIPNVPHLLVAAGKDGKIYLINRDNLGKFNPNGDNVVNAVPNGTGQNTPPVLINGSLSAPAYFQGEIYWVSGYDNNAKAFIIGSNGTLQPTSQTAQSDFGYEPGSVIVSANNNSNGIVWIMDRKNNEIHAYNALSLNTELWNSNDKPGDKLDSTVKFGTPTEANGQLFVGTSTALTVYGLKGVGTPAQAPSAPANLSAQALSGSAVELSWTDSTVSPNFATSYLIQDSTNGTTFTTVATAGQQATSFTLTGLNPNTQYTFQIIGTNSSGPSSPSNTVSATTTGQTGTTPTAPVGLGATPAGPAQVFLTWVNTASNEANFVLTRATDSNFTQNVVTLTLPAAPFNYTDTAAGLSTGGTYFYKIRATNSSGSSSSSNLASVTIPLVPPQPTNATAVVNGTQMAVSWTDNAGPYALGYQIFRSVDGGAHALYANVPETSDAPPSTITYTDTNIPLGHIYTYEIEAHNISGFSAPAVAVGPNLGSATLNLDAAGNLSFTSGAGVPDRLALQLAAGIYTLSDPAVIIAVTGAGASSVTGAGTSTLTFPATAVVAMNLNTSDGTDSIDVISADVPVTIAATSGGGAPTILLGDPSNSATINGTITNQTTSPLTILGTGPTNINGDLIGQGTGSGVVIAGSGVVSIAGNINLGTGNVTDSDSNTVIINGNISGNNVTMSGTGSLTLSGNNSYIGTTTINSGTVTVGSSTALGSSAGGSVIVNGGRLALPAAGGIILPAGKAISLAGAGIAGNGALESLGGNNTINGPISVAAVSGSIGADGGTLVLGGNITQLGNLTFVGAGNVNVNGAITGQGSAAGLLESQASGNIFTGTQTAPNLQNYGFDAQLYPFMGTTSSAVPTTYGFYPTGQHIWSNNDTWMYQGFINVPNFNGTGFGYISFAKSIDDSVRINIDGVTVLTSTTFNSSLGSGELTLASGWHAIDIRLANGGGGAGADGSNTNGWTGFVAGGTTGNNTGGGNGLVYRIDNGPNDPLGNSTSGGNAASYSIPVDNGHGNLFVYEITSLIMNGTGTVSLNASNPGKDAITVNSGILAATVSGSLGTTASSTPLPVTVNGGTLAIQGGVTLPTSQPLILSGNGTGGLGALEFLSGTNVINGTTTLVGGATINVASNVGLTLNGKVLGGSGNTLTKAGTGTMSLASTSNTYLGSTTVNSGTLQISADGSLGANPSSTVTVNAAILDINQGANNQSTKALVLGSANSAIQVDGVNTFSFASTVTGAGTLNKTGTGTLALSGAGSYSATIVAQGTLQISNPQALGTGQVKMNGGQLSILGGSGSQQTIPLAAASFNQDVIWGGSELNNTPSLGTSTDLDGDVLYQSGAPFAPLGGLPASGLLDSAANTAVAFQLQPYTQNNVLLASDANSHAMTFATPVAVQALNVLSVAPNGAATYNLTINFTDGTHDSANFTNQAVPAWTGAAGAAVPGPGVIARQVNNIGLPVYTTTPPIGNMYEQDFNLTSAMVGGVADSTKTISSVVFTKVAGTTLGIFAISGNVPANSQAYSNPILVAADATIDVENQSASFGNLSIGTNALTVFSATGNFLAFSQTNLTGSPTFSVAGGATFNPGSLNDGGNAETLNFNGAGTTNLNAVANSLVSGTAVNISNGLVNANIAGDLGVLPLVNVASGAVAVNAFDTWGALSGAGIVDLNGNTLTVGGSSNVSSKFDGSITDGSGSAGSGGLIKAGTVTFTLSASSNSPFTGPTTISAGTLLVDGSLTSSAVALNGGTLGGTGTIGSSVTALAGTNVSPGDAPGTTGSLTTGSMVMTQGGAFNVELGGTGPGQFDQLVIPPTGTIQLNTGGMGGGGLGGVALNLSLVNGFTPTLGQQFKIIDIQGAVGVTGKFFGPINQLGTITVNQRYQFTVNYVGGDGDDVVLTVSAVSGQVDHFTITPPSGLTTVPAGTPVMFTVTALDANNLLASNYTGTLTFSSSTDHQALLPTPGTLTNGVGTFTATFLTAGQETLTATDLAAQPTLTGTSAPALLVTPLATSALVITAPPTVFVGQQVNFTVTATDQYGNPTGSAYTGTVQFSSTDSSAPMPPSTTLTNGTGTFQTIFTKTGSPTITAQDSASKGILGNTGVIDVSAIATKFKVTPNFTTIAAGTPFSVTVTAVDDQGNIANGYAGTIQITTNGGNPVLPPNALLTNGVGVFTVALTMVAGGPWTVTASQVGNTGFTGNSVPITVTPLAAAYFNVSNPGGTVITGTFFAVTVQAFDVYNNVASGYTGQISLTTNDPKTPTLVANYQFTNTDAGSHLFSNLSLATGGNRFITATDLHATNPIVAGTSAAIITRGLLVSSFTPTPDGFTATFNKAFVPGDLTLFGSSAATPADIQMHGSSGIQTIHGSLLIDPSNQKITFKATASYLQELNALAHPGIPGYNSVVLPDSTYTVTFISGTSGNGFLDSFNQGLDGQNNGGVSNFTTTFTTHFQADATPVLGIPDFARGPDSNTPIAVPANGVGIPITLYNAAGVTDVSFSLSYNPNLLNISGAFGGAGSDATDQSGGTLSLISNVAGVATFHYADTTPFSATPASPLILGDIQAVVPSGPGAAALSLYQVKELLQLGSIVINANSHTGAVGADGLHVNAYFADVNASKTVDGLDKLLADNVAQGKATGFDAFSNVDPVIIADVAGDLSVDAGDVTAIDSFVALLHPVQIPQPPTQLLVTDPNYVNPNSIHSPNAADPTLSLTRGLTALGSPVVSVMIDHPDPTGSTGLTSVTLALTYDPTVLSVSPSDITLGPIPAQGSGWQLFVDVDQATGQIGIELYSDNPIVDAQAGSLVNIAFHSQAGEPRGVSPPMLVPATIQLVAATTPNGHWYGTMLADAQGGMILSPGISEISLGSDVAFDSNREELPPQARYEANQDSPIRILINNDAPAESENRRPDAAPLAGAESKEEAPVIVGLVPPTNGQVWSPDLRTPPGVQVFQIGGIPLLNVFLDQQSPARLEITRLLEALARPEQNSRLETFQDLLDIEATSPSPGPTVFETSDAASVDAASDVPFPSSSIDADSGNATAKLFAQAADDGDFCDLLP